ncbi:hypothetical protein WMY93_019083 [Mugilogobius chulae]|uniref:Reverse transcriptase domain-containing protein n=1 Tax=Mugilogobius chulae TaxID=88201 RepID=A0AAW0ND59_9GOBI
MLDVPLHFSGEVTDGFSGVLTICFGLAALRLRTWLLRHRLTRVKLMLTTAGCYHVEVLVASTAGIKKLRWPPNEYWSYKTPGSPPQTSIHPQRIWPGVDPLRQSHTGVVVSEPSRRVPNTSSELRHWPILKKPTLDPETLSSYRPISNLPFLSKIIEKAVAAQILEHIQSHNLFDKFQSGFRPAHSTETALVRVTNDLLMAAEQGFPSLLILLDLTAAFDTIDHHILLHRLQHQIGLTGLALKWFQSYLTDRTEHVALGNARSNTHLISCGVPQGSVLGPTLFNIYMLPLGQIITKHGISFHSYADDTQLYIRMDNSSPTPTPISLALCLEEIKTWMTENFLQLNTSKTEAILIGTQHQIQSSEISVISILGQHTKLSTSVTNLGIKFDPHLSFEAHIQHLCKISFYHLRNISKLRPFLSLADAEKLVHAFISSRLDYCNALLIGSLVGVSKDCSTFKTVLPGS